MQIRGRKSKKQPIRAGGISAPPPQATRGCAARLSRLRRSLSRLRRLLVRTKPNNTASYAGYSSNRSTATRSPPQPYSAAKARNIKIFSAREIAESSGMRQAYRKFWNNKAEELCCTSALKTFKPGEIQGAINVAWTIKKTDFLKDQMEEVNKQIASKSPVDLLKKFQLSRTTLKKNTERVETAVSSLQDIQRELTSARQECFDSRSKTERQEASLKVDQLEKDLES